MATPLYISINLQQLEWTKLIYGGGGGGYQETPSASPYLWTIFFKADGETLTLQEDGILTGAATIVFTPGSHGNLGTQSVNVGEPITVPPGIGQWTTVLQPIPVPASLQPLVGATALDGMAGLVYVLMLHNHVSDQGAEAGHQELNRRVQAALATVIEMLGPGHTMVTQQDIADATRRIPGQVQDAIIKAQSFWENLWSVSGVDDPRGFETLLWSASDFTGSNGSLPISRQIGAFYDQWQLDGVISAKDICSTLSPRISATRPGASSCSRNLIVSGQQCTLTAQVNAPMLPVNQTFNFSWAVEGGTISAERRHENPTIVSVNEEASQIIVSITVTDNFGCLITQSSAFPTRTPDFVSRIDRICELRSKIQTEMIRIPNALLHIWGPDPGPERMLAEIGHAAEELASEARSLLQLIQRSR
jgi:hypothetical protein